MTVEEIRGNMGGERGNNYDNFPIGMRVLAVDDNPSCLKLLDGLLRKCQYHVTTTSQARMALKMLRENRDRFDLVISDVHMPDMDGFKLLELVGLEMDLPVIMLSANSDRNLVMKGISHGACDYLVKPVRLEELRNIWQHVIRKKKSNKTNDQDKSGDGGQGQSMTGHSDQNGKLNKKRKDEEDDNDDNGDDNDDPATQKKARVVWSIELHRKFVAAVNQLGIERAVPKRILDLMNFEGLTRENVASHLQKYRLYLKRISAEATQQANMVAALGGKDSAYMRMSSLDGLGDFRTLSGSGRYAHGGMLGRLNSASGLSIRNLAAASPLLQHSHGQNLSNAFNKLSPNIPPASQNSSLFQGIPASLELDQFQPIKPSVHIPLDDVLQGNPMLLHGNSQQPPSGVGFGNQQSHNMNPFISDSFNSAGVDDSWQNSVQLSKFQSNSFSSTEPLINGHLSQNSVRVDNSLAVPHLQHSSLEFPSTATTVSSPFEDSRRDIQFREGISGAVQCMNQTWPESKQHYSQNSNNAFGDLSNELFSRRMDKPLIGRLNGVSSTVVQHTENEKLTPDARSRSNEDYLLEPPKQQLGFSPHGFGSLDDILSTMKREQHGSMLEEEQYGFNNYPFGV